MNRLKQIAWPLFFVAIVITAFIPGDPDSYEEEAQAIMDDSLSQFPDSQ